MRITEMRKEYTDSRANASCFSTLVENNFNRSYQGDGFVANFWLKLINDASFSVNLPLKSYVQRYGCDRRKRN
ncbi:unnamed protein product [Larinioides sclopetarius]|uniref:Uncharacterized protein n=1 Tax=Larinioides sclopetarius TaxID=280406 RepID=A0AAV1ZDT0_9ARAC